MRLINIELHIFEMLWLSVQYVVVKVAAIVETDFLWRLLPTGVKDFKNCSAQNVEACYETEIFYRQTSNTMG